TTIIASTTYRIMDQPSTEGWKTSVAESGAVVALALLRTFSALPLSSACWLRNVGRSWVVGQQRNNQPAASLVQSGAGVVHKSHADGRGGPAGYREETASHAQLLAVADLRGEEAEAGQDLGIGLDVEESP